jgi:hypothetical protein
VVGGLAINQAGYTRLTEDVDLLIEITPENEAKVIQALLILPDRAAAELKARGDWPVRCGARGGRNSRGLDGQRLRRRLPGSGAHRRRVVVREIDGVPVPFASPQTLWRMKQTVREKDIPDRLFLRQWHGARGLAFDPPLPPGAKGE